MFYYINQSRTPSFRIILVTTKPGFIVRSVGLGRWMLVVVGISVNVYSFFSFHRPDLSPWGYRNRFFLVALCCLIVRTPNLEVATKWLLHQVLKILGVSYSACKCVPLAISGSVNVSKIPRCHLLRQMTSQWWSQKFPLGLVSHELTANLSIFNLFLTHF